MQDKIVGWFTANGHHIPIHEGESKDDALKKWTTTGSSKVVSKATTSKSDSEVASKATSQKVASKSSADTLSERQQEQRKRDAERRNAEEAYQDSLKQGNKVGVSDGHLTYKGKAVKKLNTKDANTKYEMPSADGKTTIVGDSLTRNTGKDGELTPERLAQHQKIIQEYLESANRGKGVQPYKPGEEKVAYFTGGGGAAGKGGLSGYKEEDGVVTYDGISKYYSKNNHPVVVDPDELKKRLAEVDTGSDMLTPHLSAYYHEESSAMAKQIYSMMLENNMPVMFDGTATSIGSTIKKINEAKANGYMTEMAYIFSSWNTVRANSLNRYDRTGRLVPIESLLGAHSKAYDAVMGLFDKFDSFKLFDNSSKKMTLTASSTGGSKLTTHSTDSMKAFKQYSEEFNNIAITPAELDAYKSDTAKITAKRASKSK